MWQKIKNYLYVKLIKPFKDSKSPANEVAWGAMIGMFWAMTPLVGIQMTVVTINWLMCRLVKFRFSLPIAMVMVWLSNPFTMGPLYYMFYLVGYYSFIFAGANITQISYLNFTNRLDQSLAMGAIDGSIDFVIYIAVDMGWPMLIGGFVVAIPMSILAYFAAFQFVNHHRKHLAKKEGVSLAEWEHRHVKGHPLPPSFSYPSTGTGNVNDVD